MSLNMYRSVVMILFCKLVKLFQHRNKICNKVFKENSYLNFHAVKKNVSFKCYHFISMFISNRTNIQPQDPSYSGKMTVK